MKQVGELSGAREIETSLDFATGFLVFGSLYLAFSIWYAIRSVQNGHWTQVVLGVFFLVMGSLGILRSVLRIKEIVRRLLTNPPATL